MAGSDVSLVTKLLTRVNEGFTSTAGGTISSGATTVPVTDVTGLVNGTTFVGIIEPGQVKQQVFTGVVDTGGSQITGVKWTRGTNVSHSAGVTIVDYTTGTAFNMLTKWAAVDHNDDGTHKALSLPSLTVIGNITAGSFTQSGVIANGWNTGLAAPNTVTALGNRGYNLVFNSVDLTSTLSAGMRIRTQRTVAAPTQSTLLNGTTQFYSKTTPAGMSFTDDFTVSAWVKLTKYPSTNGYVISRYNGTSGWGLFVSPTGQPTLVGFNGGTANASNVASYQSLPLNRWVHIAGQLDMSAFAINPVTGSYMMIDGVDVPAFVTRGGTNPTALVQAGNLEVGSAGAANFFPGAIAQVAVYNSKVTQANIIATMSQTLTGSESTLISAFSFNNSLNDLNGTSANNLTPNASAVATNADSPFGGQAGDTINANLDYGIVQSVSFSTNTTVLVQVSEGNTIPTTGGVASVVYSSNRTPYGMPSSTDKWSMIYVIYGAAALVTGSIAGVWGKVNGTDMMWPIGKWNVKGKAYLTGSSATPASFTLQSQIAPVSPTGQESNENEDEHRANTNLSFLVETHHWAFPISLSVATANSIWLAMTNGSGTQNGYTEPNYRNQVRLENAYL